jgi:hypothetical protein
MREWRHAPGGFVAKRRIGDSSPRSAGLGMTWARGVPLLSFRANPEPKARGERGIPEARDWTGSHRPIHYDGGPVATRPPEEKHR